MLLSNENIIQFVREASVFIMEVWGLILACDVHTALFCYYGMRCSYRIVLFPD